MKKLLSTFALLSLLFTETILPQEVDAAPKVYHVKAKHIGYADNNTFEVKTSKGKVYVMRSSNEWYRKNLKEGKTYTYFYKKDKYKRNIIVKVNK